MPTRYYREGKYKVWLAKDLTEAYKLGFFVNSMTRWELMGRLIKHNDTLKWFSNAAYRSLYDTAKGENGFICGIPHNMIIPRYSIMEYNFELDRKLEYTNMYGEKVGEEIVNPKESEYKALSRGWETIFAIVEKNGYAIDRKGL